MRFIHKCLRAARRDANKSDVVWLWRESLGKGGRKENPTLTAGGVDKTAKHPRARPSLALSVTSGEHGLWMCVYGVFVCLWVCLWTGFQIKLHVERRGCN